MGRTGTVGRRALLAAGAAAGAVTLAGCTSEGGTERPGKPSAAERAARAEAALRRSSAATSRTLRERYDAVLAAHPALTGRLTPLRAAVAEQAAALAGDRGSAGNAAPSADTRSADPTGSATPSGSATPGAATSAPGPVPVPADPAVALKELAAVARRTADAHAAALLGAEPEYARLLASVAASGAAHAYLLTEGGRA
ncbi:hypothetical protein Q5762_22040 [Streptomyces sp. P9(2023)]|uniref:hypothetical protein n=1 Tax=Streptomyces sp. P9(2023) TaxID=3064394 RepID=UPI0028F433D2|nr:hypothetical protein [Streptomyces sp. P9(2023)]MDT9690981.1 hypothetical protein [Streptomyces sp. P9(2023)]